jgi:hypothetical protein
MSPAVDLFDAFAVDNLIRSGQTLHFSDGHANRCSSKSQAHR